MSTVLVDRELVVRLCHTDNSISQSARRELRNIYLGAHEQPAGEVPTIGHSDYVSQLETRIAELEAELEAANELLVRQAKANIELRTELATMRDQVPVAEVTTMGFGRHCISECGPHIDVLMVGTKLYDAPVSKPQVVMPKRMHEPMPLWADVRKPGEGRPLNREDITEARSFNSALDEVARLNTADRGGTKDE
jgi:hypothetical protein